MPAPAVLNFPALQLRQPVEAAAVEYWPATQLVHEVTPAAENDPAAQAVHVLLAL